MNGTVILNGTEGYPGICQVSGFEIVAVSKVFQTPGGQRETAILYAEENVDIRRYDLAEFHSCPFMLRQGKVV